ncbi:PH domain-containing protein [Cryobacterium sp. TMS1-13-1]|uniref:PH domain-containing protein n=1 Tax=Cryobacterium sp. TMS1-13-1 TaxID=1259220 RepID=UPI001069ABEB|nr:PH domain-containing protein [Cryobacterium sp. TMS1-13-1]TFD24304.1 PH domain-containing protein [Cryobacterium sp. TMS1-13-1]
MNVAADPIFFYSRFNRIIAAAFTGVAALSALSLFLLPTASNRALVVPALFVMLFVWEVLWNPSLDVDDDAVTIRNPLRTIVVPWAALVHVDTKFALTLYTPGKKFAVFCAPAPGRSLTSAGRRKTTDPVPYVSGSPRPGDLPGSESGEAAQLVRSRWDALQKSGRVDGGLAAQTPVTVVWAWGRAGVLAAVAAASIVALLLA